MRTLTAGLSAAITLAMALSACERGPSSVPAQRATEKGDLDVSAQGVGLDSMSVTMTSTRNDSIVFPVGTRFNSASSGTQNMISAATITFVFTSASPSSPQTIVLPVPVYCVDRWLDVPTPASSFSVSYTEETDPLRKLAACLESDSAPHQVKQLAIWMVSDSLMDITQDELAAKFLDESEQHWRETYSTGDKAAEEIKKRMPEADPAFIDRVRQMTSAELEELLDTVRPGLRRDAALEVKTYVEQTPALLSGCGYDLSTKRFFQR